MKKKKHRTKKSVSRYESELSSGTVQQPPAVSDSPVFLFSSSFITIIKKK